MNLSEELIYRGFQAETTIKDPKSLDAYAPQKFYCGFDPSADSLTIGNLATLMLGICFIRHGFEPYILVGGATGQIGDPKENSERELKSTSEVDHNKSCIRAQIERIIKSNNLTLLDNLDWFRHINYLDFLREVGKNFSMTQLLDRQFVQNRIGGAGISYAEFSYTLIQGYDFLHLYREYGITLQLCGADQYGNCTSGIHLIRRLENADANVWSTPLIIDPITGRKFGKSEGNAIWLAGSDNGSENYTPIFDFYQFWLGQPDSAVENLLKTYTLLDKSEICAIMEEHNAAPEKRVAQRKLAFCVTEIVHGRDNAKAVQNLTNLLFDRNTNFAEFQTDEILAFAEFLPTVERGVDLIEALVTHGLADSKKKAREFLAAGAITVSGTKVTETLPLTQPAIIKKGKNKFLIVK